VGNLKDGLCRDLGPAIVDAIAIPWLAAVRADRDFGPSTFVEQSP
jgi:hypothetical protein